MEETCSSLTKWAGIIEYVMAERKLTDEKYTISNKRGNGTLRREIWVDSATGTLTRYNLAYINRALCSADNGRVIGYDNAHGGHHRYYMGTVEPVKFVSFEDIEEKFTKDWTDLLKGQPK